MRCALRVVFSVGGLIASMAAIELGRVSFPLKGLVLSSALFMMDPKLATPPLKLAARVLSAVVPKLVLAGLPSRLISRNAAAVAAYDADPLVFRGGARARVGAELLRGVRDTLPLLGTLACPALLLHGTQDAVVPLGASLRAFNRLAHKDKTLIRYKGCFHEMSVLQHQQRTAQPEPKGQARNSQM